MAGTPRDIRAVLFDLWNTLVYSSYRPNPMLLIAEALGIAGQPGWKKVIERGMMTRRFLGIREGLEALERSTGSRLASPAVHDELVRRWNEACAATRFYDDVLPAVRSLARDHRLGIVSNTQSFDLEFLREPSLASSLDVICLSCDEGWLKPDPALFAEAAAALKVAPERILMVGDNPEDDVRGALSAGMQAVLLDRAGGSEATGGTPRRIRSLTELTAWLV